MNTKRIIKWEFWQNPYGYKIPEFVSEEEANTNSYEDADEEPSNESKVIEVRPVLPTPMGLLPISPFKNFTDVFDFWIGHTNFWITKSVSRIIQFSPGVETYDLFSPYRFRIGIGKAFNGPEVKYAIQKSLNALPLAKGEINPYDVKITEEIKEKVAFIKSDLSDKNTYWAIYVMLNGEIEHFGSSLKKEYDEVFQIYNRALELAGGVIYNYA